MGDAMDTEESAENSTDTLSKMKDKLKQIPSELNDGYRYWRRHVDLKVYQPDLALPRA